MKLHLWAKIKKLKGAPNTNVCYERITARRLELELSQVDVCNKLQLQGIMFEKEHWYNLENNKRTLLDFQLIVIAKVLRCDPHSLLNWNDNDDD